MTSQEIPAPEARKAWQKLEKEWKKALEWEAEGQPMLAMESSAKVVKGIVEWFPLSGADRKIKEDDDDAEDFNEYLQCYKAGDFPSCIRGCNLLLQNAADLSFWMRNRVWCLKAVAVLSQPAHCMACPKQPLQEAIYALRCAHLGEAEAAQVTDEEMHWLALRAPLPLLPPVVPETPAAAKAPQGTKASAKAPAVPKGEICPMCHERVEKLKAHKKKCPQKEVQCKQCKTRCAADSLEKHMRDECENRDVKCNKCEIKMKHKDLNYHQLCQCDHGVVKCLNDGCRWSGLRKDEAEHTAKCLYLRVTCMHCLLEVVQKDMPGHRCDPVDMGAPCSVCLDSFSNLARKELPPVMMLINHRRSCVHVQCMKCAQSWSQRNADQGLATCPVCRSEYDSTTPVPEYLLRQDSTARAAARARGVRQTILRPPLPRPEEMRPGGKFFVSPLDVRFTHDSVSECFAPYMKDGVQLTDKERLKILSSAKELLDGDEEPKALEMLDVVWYKNHLYVAGTFNRRLCMYRLLALFATERFGLIKVQVKSQDEIRQKLTKSYTTKNEGRIVTIRSPHAVFKVGQSRQELHWPEAMELLGGGGEFDVTPSESETEEEVPVVESPKKDMDRVVAAMAEFHHMPLDQVKAVLNQLSEEQRWLTCKRFRHDPEFGACPAVKRFEKFVQSCISNGFRERHAMDSDPDGCFEQILKASGVEMAAGRGAIAPGTRRSGRSASRLRSTDGPQGAVAFPFPPPPLGRARAARSLSPSKPLVAKAPPKPAESLEGSSTGNPQAFRPGMGQEFEAGDWTCPLCGDHQFRRNATCRKCGEAKPMEPSTGPTIGVPMGNAPVFKVPPPTFRDRSPPSRSSVKAPPPSRSAAPTPPAPPPRGVKAELAELKRRLSQRQEDEAAKERTEFLQRIRTLEAKNAALEEENTHLLGQLTREREAHQEEVADLQGRLDAVFSQLKELQEPQEEHEDSRSVLEPAEASAPSGPSGPAPGSAPRRSRWGQGRKAEAEPAEPAEPAEAAEPAEPAPKDAADPWWNGEDPWFRDPNDSTGEVQEDEWQDPWKSYGSKVAANSEDIERFAGHWKLEVSLVNEILEGLQADEVLMVLRRFRVARSFAGGVEMILRRYVESCRRNGFKKYHSTDSLAHFASSWNLQFQEVEDLFWSLNLEQQNQVIKGFWHEDTEYWEAMTSLRSYVGYLSKHDFQPPETWEAFATKWNIPPQDVASIFDRLEEEQAALVIKRFMHNRQSTQTSAAAQLRNYVRSCVSRGFWK